MEQSTCRPSCQGCRARTYRKLAQGCSPIVADPCRIGNTSVRCRRAGDDRNFDCLGARFWTFWAEGIDGRGDETVCGSQERREAEGRWWPRLICAGLGVARRVVVVSST